VTYKATPFAQILLDIVEERRRQDFLKSQGKFAHTCADAMPASMKLAVLAEEFGEVAKSSVRSRLREPERRARSSRGGEYRVA
jgi:hypothetical protein